MYKNNIKRSIMIHQNIYVYMQIEKYQMAHLSGNKSVLIHDSNSMLQNFAAQVFVHKKDESSLTWCLQPHIGIDQPGMPMVGELLRRQVFALLGLKVVTDAVDTPQKHVQRGASSILGIELASLFSAVFLPLQKEIVFTNIQKRKASKHLCF